MTKTPGKSFCDSLSNNVSGAICRKYIDEEVVWKIFTQIVLALDECHNRKGGVVLHRDVKPDNILLDKENNVKLSDFGLSRVLNSGDVMAQTFLGTPYYMSPVSPFYFLSSSRFSL